MASNAAIINALLNYKERWSNCQAELLSWRDRISTKPSQDSRRSGRDSNRPPSERKAIALLLYYLIQLLVVCMAFLGIIGLRIVPKCSKESCAFSQCPCFLVVRELEQRLGLCLSTQHSYSSVYFLGDPSWLLQLTKRHERLQNQNNRWHCYVVYGKRKMAREHVQSNNFFLFESPFICKLYRYCKITRGMKRSAQ
jgi:hypothetical protein